MTQPTFESPHPLREDIADTSEIIDDHGSFIVRGPKFSVLQCRGPVLYRQKLATERAVICYSEAHLNSFPNPDVQHGFVITGSSVPPKTVEWAGMYLRNIEHELHIPTKGIVRNVPGQGCVMHVKWPTPTMLLEPCFMSQPDTARFIYAGGFRALGRALADSIVQCFPSGGLVGLSVGHLYRGGGDRGARAPADEWSWDKSFDDEGELCDAYVNDATERLVSTE
jgi:hypothetical protein